MTTFTHKDKLDLNRRARAHGLPDLWPEAEDSGRIRARLMPAIHSLTDGWKGGIVGRLPAQPQPPPWMTETAAEAVERFKREGGLTTECGSAIRRAFLWLRGYWPVDP